ncbi:MAG TPA: hypothetical protein VK654_07195 [Nitrospirota bacterium]|nr:hypothetical protein [Nitrospirota bacterium]
MTGKNSTPQPQDKFARFRQSFVRKVRDRFFLRFHMMLILGATILCGVLFSKLLLLAHVHNMVIRYPLAVLLSYAAFFIFVKLWLYYISSSAAGKQDTAGNIVSDLPDLSNLSASTSEPPVFSGGGGTSGGGGISAAFNGPADAGHQVLSTATVSSESSSGAADAAGSALSGIFDGDDGVVLVAIIVLLAAVVGSSLYLVYDAPHILADAAFNFLLASGLIKRYKTMTQPEWVGSVFKATWLPFFAVMAIATGVAWFLHSRYPQVTKLSDFFAPLVQRML